MVETDLYIHVSDTTLEEGQPLRVWGYLLTEAGVPLQYAQICLKDKDWEIDDYLKHEDGSFVCQTITNTSGFYDITWNVKRSPDDFDKSIELYAEFKTSGNYIGSTSDVIDITIVVPEEPPEEEPTNGSTKLTINVDKTSVTEGEEIKIWGYLKTVDGRLLQGGRIWLKDKNDWPIVDEILQREYDINSPVYDDTDSNGYYQIRWDALFMDSLGNDIELYAEFDGSGVYEASTTKDNIIKITITEVPEEVPKGQIGSILFEIIEKWGKDDVEFTIPITNTSNQTTYNYIKLFDSTGKEIEREPDTLAFSKSIAADDTINILLTSNVEDVKNQVLTFKLYSSFSKISGDGLVDTKTITPIELPEEVKGIALNVTIEDTLNKFSGNVLISVLYGLVLKVDHVCDSPKEIAINETAIWEDLKQAFCISRFSLGDTVRVVAVGNDKEGNVVSVGKDITLMKTTNITINMSTEEVSEEENECFIRDPISDKCLVTNEQADWIKYGGLGLIGLYVFSTIAPIIKGVGHVFEKKTRK